LTTLLFAFSAGARNHSALNGTWTLVPAKSDFAGQAVVQTGTVTIDDKEGVIIVSRNFFYRDVTDAENNATIHTGKDIKSKTRWDHGVLKVTTTQSGAITLESYALAADGTMMVSVVRPESKPITLVFQRK
jgi:flagellar capping protein FliD